MTKVSKAINARRKYFLFVLISQPVQQATITYNKQVDKTVAGILSHTANENSFTQIINLFIPQVRPPTSLPSHIPINGSGEKATNAMAAYRIMDDSGTAIRLVIK